MSQIKNCYITVAGVPWEQLTEEHKRKIIQRNTDVAAKIVTNVVIQMAEEGRTIEEISKFLGLDSEAYKNVNSNM